MNIVFVLSGLAGISLLSCLLCLAIWGCIECCDNNRKYRYSQLPAVDDLDEEDMISESDVLGDIEQEMIVAKYLNRKRKLMAKAKKLAKNKKIDIDIEPAKNKELNVEPSATNKEFDVSPAKNKAIDIEQRQLLAEIDRELKDDESSAEAFFVNEIDIEKVNNDAKKITNNNQRDIDHIEDGVTPITAIRQTENSKAVCTVGVGATQKDDEEKEFKTLFQNEINMDSSCKFQKEENDKASSSKHHDIELDNIPIFQKEVNTKALPTNQLPDVEQDRRCALQKNKLKLLLPMQGKDITLDRSSTLQKEDRGSKSLLSPKPLDDISRDSSYIHPTEHPMKVVCPRHDTMTVGSTYNSNNADQKKVLFPKQHDNNPLNGSYTCHKHDNKNELFPKHHGDTAQDSSYTLPKEHQLVSPKQHDGTTLGSRQIVNKDEKKPVRFPKQYDDIARDDSYIIHHRDKKEVPSPKQYDTISQNSSNTLPKEGNTKTSTAKQHDDTARGTNHTVQKDHDRTVDPSKQDHDMEMKVSGDSKLIHKTPVTRFEDKYSSKAEVQLGQEQPQGEPKNGDKTERALKKWGPLEDITEGFMAKQGAAVTKKRVTFQDKPISTPPTPRDKSINSKPVNGITHVRDRNQVRGGRQIPIIKKPPEDPKKDRVGLKPSTTFQALKTRIQKNDSLHRHTIAPHSQALARRPITQVRLDPGRAPARTNSGFAKIRKPIRPCLKPASSQGTSSSDRTLPVHAEETNCNGYYKIAYDDT